MCAYWKLEVSQVPSVTRSCLRRIVPIKSISVPATTCGIWAIEKLFVAKTVDGPLVFTLAIFDKSVESFMDKGIKSFRSQVYTSSAELKGFDCKPQNDSWNLVSCEFVIIDTVKKHRAVNKPSHKPYRPTSINIHFTFARSRLLGFKRLCKLISKKHSHQRGSPINESFSSVA